MSAAIRKKAACTCCTSDPACPDPLSCPDEDSLYRVACGGAHQYLTNVTAEGSTTANWNTHGGGPIVSNAAMKLTFSTPPTPPGPAAGTTTTFGQWYWLGYYKRIGSYVFDGTDGVGAAIDLTLTDRQADDYPARSRDHYSNAVTSSWTGNEIVAEQIVINSQFVAMPSFSQGAGSFGVGGGANITFSRARRATYVQYNFGARPDQTATVGYSEGTQDVGYPGTIGISGGGYNDQATPPYPHTGFCKGDQQSGQFNDSITGARFGNYTVKLVDPGPVAGDTYAIRNCPCAISLLGTLYVSVRTDTGQAVDPSDPPAVDPESEDRESPPIAFAPATLDVRLTREAGKGCGSPLGRWTGGGTITVGGGQPLVVSGVQIDRVGPRLYYVTGSIEGVQTYGYDGTNTNGGTQTFGLHYTSQSECPDGVVDTEQFAPQFRFANVAAGDSQADADAAAYVPAVPGHTSMTENALIVAAANRSAGDPPCGCDESSPYLGDDDDGEDPEGGEDAAAAHVQSVLDDDAGSTA